MATNKKTPPFWWYFFNSRLSIKRLRQIVFSFKILLTNQKVANVFLP